MTCTWCGHPPHPAACPRNIRVFTESGRKKTADTPCPCANRKALR